MPGSKYVIIGCNISRKHELALFQIPAKDDEYNTVWRNSIIDAGLKEQIEDDRFTFVNVIIQRHGLNIVRIS